MKKKRLYSTLCAWLFSALAIGGNISAVQLMPDNALTAGAYLTAAAEGKCGENASWTLDGSGRLTISGTGASNPTAYPDSNWDRYANSIREVVIEQGITEIGSCSFSYCPQLTSVSIPDSVTSIGYSAFNNCANLTSLTLPASVTSLQRSFAYETGIQAITVDPENPVYCSADGVVFSKDMTKLVCVPDGYAADEYAIPDSVTEIGDEAFFSCEKLTSVIIPEGVEIIGRHAFCFCMGLVSVDIPESVTVIRAHAFNKCDALQHVTMPKNLTEMGEAVFYLDANLRSVELPQNLTVIPDETFNSAHNLKKAEIPDTVQSIEFAAYTYCTSLKKITIPENVSKLGPCAFKGCRAMQYAVVMNPDCEFYPEETVFNEGTVIYGHPGSTAQTYAETYGFTFEDLANLPAEAVSGGMIYTVENGEIIITDYTDD
ncbi:MAG: leucine-rich repeat domain-containing protein, partial [Oscillospiraceae bacterium]|nr:leucine-rich repeat domain-containing protein [Oscillospiraceae bacterium]